MEATNSVYSEKEIEALNLFREQVQPFSPGEDLSDHFLIRWLRARNLDCKKAKEMLQNYYDWKKTNALLPKPQNDEWICPQILIDDFKFSFLGCDKEHRPAILIPLGRWEVRLRLEAGYKDDSFRFTYRVFDQLLSKVDEQRLIHGPSVSQFVVIMDCAELTFRKISYDTIQTALRFFREFEAYFPEVMATCYVVNAPWLFSGLFNLVKPLMSSTTIAKIKVYDFDDAKWKAVLVEQIPKEVLPKDYGGEAPPFLEVYENK